MADESKWPAGKQSAHSSDIRAKMDRVRGFHDVYESMETDQEEEGTMDGSSGGLSKLKNTMSALTSGVQSKAKNLRARAFPQQESSMDAYSGEHSKLKKKKSTPSNL